MPNELIIFLLVICCFFLFNIWRLVSKKKILLNETIKNLGNFTVEIKLYEGVIAKLKLNVVS